MFLSAAAPGSAQVHRPDLLALTLPRVPSDQVQQRADDQVARGDRPRLQAHARSSQWVGVLVAN